MRALRLLSVVLLLAVSLGATAWAKDKIVSQSTFPAIIVDVETGDYMHLVVKDAKGTTRSFFIGQAGGMLEQVAENPESFKGRKVKVTWQKVITHIPEAGRDMTIERVVKLEPR